MGVRFTGLSSEVIGLAPTTATGGFYDQEVAGTPRCAGLGWQHFNAAIGVFNSRGAGGAGHAVH